MTDNQLPADYATSIAEARQRMTRFVRRCTDGDWHAAPVDGDPRPVGVIADHVAHSYEYLAGWIADVAEGKPVEVDSDIVDELNAEHASDAATVTRAHVIGHLQSSGDAVISLIAGLEPDQLDLDGGRIRRLAVIAARHADIHRAELEQALAST